MIVSKFLEGVGGRGEVTDAAVAEAVKDKRALISLGLRSIKGYEEELPVYGVLFEDWPRAA